MSLFGRRPAITLGSSRFLFFGRRTLRITPEQARKHMHVLGMTESGKSYFLAGLFLSLFANGMPVTLIDPHGDLATFVLSHLVAQGVYNDPSAYERILYLDLPAAEAAGLHLPFNFLAQPYQDHAMAELVAEACRRAWPELATGAPTFENILKHSVIALRQANLPLTSLADLLTDTDLRDRVLGRVTDPQVVRFFRTRMEQWGRDEAHMKESTLNRAYLLTFTPFLRRSLGSPRNVLSFRELMDSGRFVIINLAIPEHDARRLLGCMLMVGMETAALSRADNRTARVAHHLMIDEFSQFMAQSETALTRMLSETRKYGLFSVMAHQNWTQASDRLKGALQNVGIEVILKSGRMDAEYSSRILGTVDPMQVKHVVVDEQAEERTHPTYVPLPEQWERHIQAIQRLERGQAFVRLPDDSVHKIKTRTLPPLPPVLDQLAEIRTIYLSRYFDRVEDMVPATLEQLPEPPAVIGRRSPAQAGTIFRRS
jgi:hypothetical protein